MMKTLVQVACTVTYCAKTGYYFFKNTSRPCPCVPYQLVISPSAAVLPVYQVVGFSINFWSYLMIWVC